MIVCMYDLRHDVQIPCTRYLPINRPYLYRYTSKKTETCENYASPSMCSAGTTVYAIVLDWPKTGRLELGAVSPVSATSVQLMGYGGGPFKWQKGSGGGMIVDFPIIPANEMPCEWAWVLQLNNLQ